jgi:probable F420-dependent oxidoreductase
MSDAAPLLGFGLPVSGSWATPETMLRIARRAEQSGYASLWTFQRILSPVAAPDESATVAVGNPSARPADDASYLSVHDAILPLAYVAAGTDRIRLGTATVCAPFTPPVMLAKAMTTLDHLCSGRLTVGVGIGWMPEEYVAAGIPYERRGARMDEYLRCLDAVWTQDPVQFDGEFYRIPLSRIDPRPVQRPRPPVLVGGSAPEALRRAGRLAEGWIASSGHDLTRLGESVRLVREGAREAGRDPEQVRVLHRAVVDLVDQDPGAGRRLFHGTAEQVRDDISALGQRGVTEVLVDVNFSPRVGSPDVDPDDATTEAERVLDALAPRPAHVRRPPPSA